MTTGRPRLESTVEGLLILGAVREILADYPDADAPLVAHELRRRRVPRLSGNLNWNDRAARTAMERVEDERLKALNARMIDSKEVVSAMAESMARDIDQKIPERYRAEIETLDATPKRPDGIGKDEWL
jgi:hypothetical protein